jgi:Restriction endonuclease
MADQSSRVQKSAKEYELLAQSIYQQLLKQEGIETIEVRHNQKIKGKSGAVHQIDVLWNFRQAGVEHMVAVECKNYGSAVEIGDVRNFHAVIEDIGVARGIIVTRVGFQSGAQQFAEHHKIDLKLLRVPVDEDWEGRVKTVAIHLTIQGRRNVKVNFQVDKPDASLAGKIVPPQSLVGIHFVNAGGQAQGPAMHEWIQSKINAESRPVGGPYQITVDTPGQYVPMHDDKGAALIVPVNSIKVSFDVTEHVETFEIDGGKMTDAVLRDYVSGQVELFHRKTPKN